MSASHPSPSDEPSADAASASVPHPPLSECASAFLRVGVESFGGPAAHIAVLHRVVVEEKRWISEERFLHALNFCMLLPGPEATQLATYVGWLLHGVRGGLLAGALFVLPGALVMLGISALYLFFHEVPFVSAAFFGVKAAILVIVADAVIRIGKRALRSGAAVTIAVLAFTALFAFQVPFPWVIACAALAGFSAGRLRPAWFPARDVAAAGVADAVRPRAEGTVMRSLGRSALAAAIGLVVWFAPVAALAAATGPDSVYTVQAVFFSKAAVVTFGGAYAVLSYVQQQAVERFAWVTQGQMLDGLGLAETTPGPLILVLQFVAFLGAARAPGGLSPLAAGTLASAVMLWTTFVPCFLWIFAFAPWVEAARGVRSLAAALAAITAAVVGVVANLGVTLSLRTLFGAVGEVRVAGATIPAPVVSSLDWRAAAIAAVAAVLLFRVKAGMAWTLAFAAAAGLVVSALSKS
ncbi:MAG: chromate efflux transporter [Planctomycetes bacterium]|nr:chromate efflux transporter [Planctomycetota bacterium]